MSNIKIIASGSYIPSIKVTNEELEKKYNVENGYIIKMTGIKQRFYAKEDVEELAIKCAENTLKNLQEKIDLIIVASTTQAEQMPSVSYKIQKHFNIEDCMCMDILAGCAGFINALDIAKMYIDSNKANTALVIGVEKLSHYIDKNDINTEILLADGAGAVVIKKCDDAKLYDSYIRSNGQEGEILTTSNSLNSKIYMNGKEVYKYAVKETVKNVKKLLEKNNINIDDVKYIIPHQSNMRILTSIAKKLQIDLSKMYSNVENIGNTFCASIPIALDEILKSNKLQENDKIILLGYGGGLNTGSILLEI